MSEIDLLGKNLPPPEINLCLEFLWRQVPLIAKSLIATHLDLSEPKNLSFLEDPDSPLEHNPEWHQWGIITHSLMVDRAYTEEVPHYLRQWGLEGAVGASLQERIDGLTKADLFRLSIPLHDLGKFSNRRLKLEEDQLVGLGFPDHEEASGIIIRQHELSTRLASLGITKDQIEYIARCAELHFKLGVVRAKAKKEQGYNFSFIRSDTFKDATIELINQYYPMQLEIGLFFLIDSLGKTDTRLPLETDDQLEEYVSEQSESRLKPMVLQNPINIAAARRYLEIWANLTSSGKLTL